MDLEKINKMAEALRAEKRSLNDSEQRTINIINTMIYYDELFSNCLVLIVSLYQMAVADRTTPNLAKLLSFVAAKMGCSIEDQIH
jgi:hypothetical protein